MSGFKLPQTVTFWTVLTNNGTCGKTYSPGVAVPARVANTNETIFTPEGKQVFANKAIYTRTAVPTGAQIIEGSFAGDASPVAGSQLVLSAASNITMSDMNKAMVM